MLRWCFHQNSSLCYLRRCCVGVTLTFWGCGGDASYGWCGMYPISSCLWHVHICLCIPSRKIRLRGDQAFQDAWRRQRLSPTQTVVVPSDAAAVFTSARCLSHPGAGRIQTGMAIGASVPVYVKVSRRGHIRSVHPGDTPPDLHSLFYFLLFVFNLFHFCLRVAP